MLGAESAGVFLSLLSPLTKPQPGDDRILVERQGDALAEIVGFAANSGKAPAEGGERPHIAVTVSLETMQAGLGHATLDDGRTLTPEQTRRLACDAAHHVHHWADGGATTLDNLVLVCPFRHRLLHHTDWTVRMGQGAPIFTPPPWLHSAAA